MNLLKFPDFSNNKSTSIVRMLDSLVKRRCNSQDGNSIRIIDSVIYKRTKRIGLFVTLIMTLAHSVFAQDVRPVDFAVLHTEAQEAESIKQIDKIIKKAEKAHDQFTKQTSGEPEAIANAILDFAAFRKQVGSLLFGKIRNAGPMSSDKIRRFFKVNKNNDREIRALLENAVEIYESKTEKRNEANLALARFELAEFYEQKVLRSTGYLDWSKYLEFLSNIQNLFSKSLGERQKLFGDQSAVVLTTTYHLANSYFLGAEYEKALPLYETYLFEIESRIYKEPRSISAALRNSLSIWTAIGNSEEVAKIESRMLKLDFVDDSTPVHLPLLSPRARSFKYKGINRLSTSFRNIGPAGLRTNGSQLEAADIGTANSIRGRPETKSPSFGVIIPGRSEIQGVRMVRTTVTVDLDGNVIAVDADTSDLKLKSKIEKSVKEWQFRPFVNNGENKMMRGIINYYLKSKR